MRRRLPFALLVVLACNSSVAGSLGAPRLTLTATPAGVEGAPDAPGTRLVRLTIRHEGGRAVALAGCPTPPSVWVERRASARWQEVGSYGLRCLAIYSTTTVKLAAGERIERVVTAGVPGRYRFIVPVGPDQTAPEFELRSASIDLP